ncbi:MAG TPA: hypothetical protein VMU67_05770 [Steroidobacteraceae bacterium]|nr:hypothetical protein [Steroidobacteraceae bacterium]
MGTSRSLLAGAAAMLLLLSGLGRAAAATDAEWLDVESRIQYGYYTEDARALEDVLASLGADDSDPLERSYYRGLASFRLALLSEARNSATARAPAEHCVASLEQAVKDAPGSGESLALESACLRVLARVRSIGGAYDGLRSNAQMRRALELSPHSPRVQLLHAIGDHDLRRDPAQVIVELNAAVAAFELERQSVERPPSWGAAEAYAYLARSLLERGDALAARSALEHALLLAPDFAYAHRLMAHITSG